MLDRAAAALISVHVQALVSTEADPGVPVKPPSLFLTSTRAIIGVLYMSHPGDMRRINHARCLEGAAACQLCDHSAKRSIAFHDKGDATCWGLEGFGCALSELRLQGGFVLTQANKERKSGKELQRRDIDIAKHLL